MAEAWIQMRCDGCGNKVTFPAVDLGSVQECPECGGYVDVPELTRAPTVFDEQTNAYARQSAETDRQLLRSGEQQEQTQRQLDQYDRLATLEEQLLQRAAGLIDRWEALAARVEQALANFESRDRS